MPAAIWSTAGEYAKFWIVSAVRPDPEGAVVVVAGGEVGDVVAGGWVVGDDVGGGDVGGGRDVVDGDVGGGRDVVVAPGACVVGGAAVVEEAEAGGRDVVDGDVVVDAACRAALTASAPSPDPQPEPVAATANTSATVPREANLDNATGR